MRRAFIQMAFLNAFMFAFDIISHFNLLIFVPLAAVLSLSFLIRDANPQRRASAAAAPPCAHRDAMPVESVLGDVIAKLCPDCDEQLDADFEPPRGAKPSVGHRDEGVPGEWP